MPPPSFISSSLPSPPRRPSARHPKCVHPTLEKVDQLRHRAATVKCPFWRRRFSDFLDATRQVLHWSLISRHKSLPLPLSITTDTTPKTPELPLSTKLQLITDDFTIRQYYITGRLTRSIYSDNCFFDGPDPDVPVRGLAKYTDAMGGLFDRRLSRVDLLDIWQVDESTIKAEWRLEGALNLPWKPMIKPYTGTTTYSFEGGLVTRHVETWSISALDAFVSVLWKGFGAQPAPSLQVLMREREMRMKSR